jgi:hypothetical protein
MTTAAIVFLMCWATLICAARTPIGRLLNRLIVEVPATALNRVEPGHIALAMIVTMLIVMHLNAGDTDPIRMVAMFAPDIALWLVSIEISAIVEALAALTAAAAALRRVGVAATFRAMSIRLPRHTKHNANRARNGLRLKRKLPANDDEDGAELALAS